MWLGSRLAWRIWHLIAEDTILDPSTPLRDTCWGTKWQAGRRTRSLRRLIGSGCRSSSNARSVVGLLD